MKKITIAISGLPGAGSSTLGKALAKELNLSFFSPGDFFKSLSKEKKQTYAALDIWKTKEGSSEDFHKNLDSIQKEMGKKGNIVIVGKLSVFMLKDIADLKVWIKATLEKRAMMVSERDGISVEEAKDKLREREEIERTYFQKIYGIDYLEQEKMADLVFENEYSKEESIKLFLEKIKERLK